MKESTVTLNGSLKMTSNVGQKLLLQALVYEVVTVSDLVSSEKLPFRRQGRGLPFGLNEASA